MKSLNERIEDLKGTRRVLYATFAAFAVQLSVFDETTPCAVCLIVAVMVACLVGIVRTDLHIDELRERTTE